MENVIRTDHINTEASRDCKPLSVPFDSVERIANALERIADSLEDSEFNRLKQTEVGAGFEVVGTQSTGEGGASAPKPSILFDHVPKAGPPKHPTTDKLAVAFSEFTGLFQTEEELELVVSMTKDVLSTAGVEKFSELVPGSDRLYVLRCLRRLAEGFANGGAKASALILENIVSESPIGS